MFDEDSSSAAQNSQGHLAQDWLINNFTEHPVGLVPFGRAAELSPLVQSWGPGRDLLPWAEVEVWPTTPLSPCCCPRAAPWPGLARSSLQPGMLACCLARPLGVSG